MSITTILGKRIWVLYPTLLSVYPALALYAANVDEVHFGEAATSIGASLLFAIGVWCLLRLVVREPLRRGAVHMMVLVAVFGFAQYMKLFGWIWSQERGVSVYLLGPAFLIGAEVVFYFGYRWLSRGDRARAATQFLNRFAVVAVLLAAGTAIWRNVEVSAAQHRLEVDGRSSEGFGGTVASRPDVYVIVLDAYGGVGVLRDYYGYDNEPFLRALEQRGFFVARNSHSNYAATKLSLSASLNLNYLHEVLGPNAVKWKVRGSLVSSSRVAEEFKSRGYRHVTFETGVAFTETPHSDLYLRPRDTISDFSAYFLETTLASPLWELWLGNQGDTVRHTSHRRRVRFALEQLRHIPRGGEPVFVYAHIVSPHGPRAFNADGSDRVVDPGLERTERGFRASYIEQIEFLNPRILAVIDAIRAHSPDAVIVIQGDHGPRYDGTTGDSTDGSPPLIATKGGAELSGESWRVYAREHLETLNAFYFPGETEYEDLHDSISQVNTFRVIFNRYFGTNYEILPDLSYLYRPGNISWYIFDTVRWNGQDLEIVGNGPAQEEGAGDGPA